MASSYGFQLTKARELAQSLRGRQDAAYYEASVNCSSQASQLGEPGLLHG